jgi:hypothetical protein
MAAEYEETVGSEACWIWPRARRYPQVMIDGRNQRAARVMYRLFVGPLPRGKHTHHTCEQPACVNYRHVTPLTPSEHNAAHHRSRNSRSG